MIISNLKRIVGGLTLGLFIAMHPAKANSDTSDALRSVYQMQTIAFSVLGDYYMFSGLEGDSRYSREMDADIKFHRFDILSDEPLPSEYDIIVSNPPYVMNMEKDEMQPNVLNHEPHLALFVDDDNPLIFYRAIIKKAIRALRENGWLYFEINELFGNEVANEMNAKGFVNVEVVKDMQGRDRIVKGYYHTMN